MSNKNWTPGPWIRSLSKQTGGSWIEHIDADYVSHQVAFVYASHGLFEPPSATEEEKANAHLIAAAPDLYEALENLLAVVYGAGGTKPNAQEISETALAKARGES